MKTVVVTGCAGFIGSNLTERLLGQGWRVVGIDNLSMGRRESIEPFLERTEFTFHQLDVRDLAALRPACQGAEILVHLAAYKIPRYGGAIQTLLVNAEGSKHVLEIAKELGCRVVMASTSDVYGKNTKLPFAESDDSVYGASTVPRWSYAVSKLYEEHLTFAYREAHGVKGVVLRFFGSYGPREHRSWWGGPQSVFIEAILDGRPLEIHGDGQQTRSFTYISDTVDGIVKAMTANAVEGEVINIGTSHEITILELAQLVHQLAGGAGAAPLKFIAYDALSHQRYEDVRRRVPDTTKAKRLLGLSCDVPLAEGLVKTIEWHRAQRAALLSGRTS